MSKGPSWTEDERNFLIANHGKMSYGELAKQLGKGTNSINNQIYALRRRGLIIGYSMSTWSDEEEQIILEHYDPSLSVGQNAKRVVPLLPERNEKCTVEKIKRMIKRGVLVDGQEKEPPKKPDLQLNRLLIAIRNERKREIMTEPPPLKRYFAGWISEQHNLAWVITRTA